jgi:hypothetical protein
MLSVTQAWIEPGPQRMLIERSRELSHLLTLLGRVHADLEAALLGPGEVVAYQTLTSRLAALDVRHDMLAHATFHALTACVTLADDPEHADALLRAQKALFPEGLDVDAPSILEEIARAERARRVLEDEDTHALLASVPLGAGSLADAAQAWLDSAETMRGVWAKRTALADRGGGDPAAIRRARLAWIRCVNAFSTLAQLVELDDGSEVLLATLHEAEIVAMQQSNEVHSTLSGHGAARTPTEQVEPDPDLLRIFDSNPDDEDP